VASLPSEVEFVEKAKEDPTVAGFNHEFRVAQRRRRTSGAPVVLPTGAPILLFMFGPVKPNKNKNFKLQ
jgi:hypothetical protein